MDDLPYVISVTRSGGFAGLRREWTIEVSWTLRPRIPRLRTHATESRSGGRGQERAQKASTLAVGPETMSSSVVEIEVSGLA